MRYVDRSLSMHERRKLLFALALLFAVTVLLVTLVQRAEAITYKRGSSGSVVSQIQTNLKNWGYYSYEVDGVYGSRTEAAVKSFQKRNGLTVDGMAGPATLSAMSLKASKNQMV